jgi:hypothetical protein
MILFIGAAAPSAFFTRTAVSKKFSVACEGKLFHVEHFAQ